jgi:hypothetical protein
MATEKKRGVWLTGWLILMLITNFFTAVMYFVFNNAIMSVYPNIDPAAGYIFGLIGLANFVFTIFLFKWKKWAFFAFCGSAIISFIMNVFIVGFLGSILGLMGPVVLYLLMKSRWNLFE